MENAILDSQTQADIYKLSGTLSERLSSEDPLHPLNPQELHQKKLQFDISLKLTHFFEKITRGILTLRWSPTFRPPLSCCWILNPF